MIRLLVVDDHAVVREGLAQLLATFEDLEVVGTAADGADAAARAQELCPDVTLMDLEMPVADGIEGTRGVLAASPATAVVMLTSFSDTERILAALDAGATGYVLKDAAPADLAAAVRAAAAGGSPLDPRAARALLDARSQPGPAEGSELSEREREVLGMVARGLPNKVIAMRLAISEKTVKAHLTRVYRAIGVSDRTQAALWAVRNGLVEDAGEGS
jgi:DNA-binding NarL/FixJ family response regulator